MIGAFFLAAFQLAQPASATVNPLAVELFERDWVLMQWAKRGYDSNRCATRPSTIVTRARPINSRP